MISAIAPALDRVPPNSIEAERAVLGAILLTKDAIIHVSAILNAEDFYRSGHAVIFKAMQKLEANGDPIDIVTVCESLRAAQTLDKAGGAAYIASLTNEVPSVAAAERYARIVHQLSFRRHVINTAYDLANGLYGHLDFEETLAALARFDAEISGAHRSVDQSVKVSECLLAVSHHLDRLVKGETVKGIETGFDEFDHACPICPGDMALVAGRPGMGKTAFGLNAAVNAAFAGIPTLFVSAEMRKEQIVHRAISSAGSVDGSKFRRGGFTEEDFAGLYRGMSKLNHIPLWIFDKGNMTATAACAEASRLARKEGIRLVVVDHIHQLAGKGDRLTVVSDAAHKFKALAHDSGLAVIVLAQLNRRVEERMPPKPQLSDLKETGTLEEAADSVILLYRQDYYTEKGIFDEGKAQKCRYPYLDGVGLLIIDKSRHGPTGAVKLSWHGKTTSFRSLT